MMDSGVMHAKFPGNVAIGDLGFKPGLADENRRSCVIRAGDLSPLSSHSRIFVAPLPPATQSQMRAILKFAFETSRVGIKLALLE
jgi:hypothetical protein